MKNNLHNSQRDTLLIFNNLSFENQKFIIQSLLHNAFSDINNLNLTKTLTNNLPKYQFNMQEIVHKYYIAYTNEWMNLTNKNNSKVITNFLKNNLLEKMSTLVKFITHELGFDSAKITLHARTDIPKNINQKFIKLFPSSLKMINCNDYTNNEHNVKINCFIHSLLFNHKKIIKSAIDFIAYKYTYENYENELFRILVILKEISVNIFNIVKDKINILDIPDVTKDKINKFIINQEIELEDLGKKFNFNEILISDFSFEKYKPIEDEVSEVMSINAQEKEDSVKSYIVIDEDSSTQSIRIISISDATSKDDHKSSKSFTIISVNDNEEAFCDISNIGILDSFNHE